MESRFESIKGMDTLKFYIEQLKPNLSEDEYELVLYASGLLENRGIAEVIELQGKQVKIDKYIAPMIADLNKQNIPTLACCSGLQAEHPGTKFKPEAGYLALAFNQDLLEYLQQSLQNNIVEVKESTCYFQPSISITIKSKDDNTLQEKWQRVWEKLKCWSIMKDN